MSGASNEHILKTTEDNSVKNGLVDQLDFTVYPNPATSRVDFFVLNGAETNHVKIYTSNGTLVNQLSFEGYSYGLDVSSYKSGVYIMMFQSGDKIMTRRFIKK